MTIDNPLRCPNCDDLISTHYDLPDCQRCGTLLPGRTPTVKYKFVSSGLGALLVAVGAAWVLMMILGIIAQVLGITSDMVATVMGAVIIAVGVSVYKQCRKLS